MLIPRYIREVAMDDAEFSQRLEALAQLPLAERADALGALYDDVKAMLDSSESD